jgi:ethanolamine utilization microcompartment shell protein EutS
MDSEILNPAFAVGVTHNSGVDGVISISPSGGIPARAGDVAGKATDVKHCYIGENGRIIESGSVMTVYNPFGTSVGGDRYILCKQVEGVWIVDAEDCG